MQQSVTALPARIPDYIVNHDWYKLDVVVNELSDGQQHLKIRRWSPEWGWQQTELFLTLDELELFKRVINAGR